MIGNKCLLDTSIIIHAFKSNNQVSEKLDALDEIFVSVTAIGELFFGAHKSENVEKHLAQIRSFLNNCTILPNDITTSEMYGKIKASLAKKGKPILKMIFG
jgi:tRNA(fMet)-specific endonuclease VapC